MSKSKRLELHGKLQDLIGVRSDGQPNVYFQPPESVKLNYPCIIYKRSTGDEIYADDAVYRYMQRYEVTTVDKDPDTPLVDAMIFAFKYINHNRFYTSNNLNYDVFDLYY